MIYSENDCDKKSSKSKNNLNNKEYFKPFSSEGIIIKDKNYSAKVESDIEQNRTILEIDKNEKAEKKLDDFELNELSYQEAVKEDKRNFFQIYFSLLRREHRVIFSFFNCNDYNLISIKLSRFTFFLLQI